MRDTVAFLAFRSSPDWGSNPQPLGTPDDAPTHWATWPRAVLYFSDKFIFLARGISSEPCF